MKDARGDLLRAFSCRVIARLRRSRGNPIEKIRTFIIGKTICGESQNEMRQNDVKTKCDKNFPFFQ